MRILHITLLGLMMAVALVSRAWLKAQRTRR